MKRKYLFIILFFLSAIPAFVLLPGSIFERLLMSIFCGAIIGLMVFPLSEIKRRKENNIDLFATLETDPEKVKARMLVVMQFGHEHGMAGALKEFSDIFRNYPQWELQNWEVFRSWYKNKIDYMLKYPDIYRLTMKSDGSPYAIENDPLYDPKAPDWEQYDNYHTHDLEDEDEDDDDDFDYYGEKCSNNHLADAFSVGVGIGLVSGLIGGAPGSSGNSGS